MSKTTSRNILSWLMKEGTETGDSQAISSHIPTQSLGIVKRLEKGGGKMLRYQFNAENYPSLDFGKE